jgi:hypothetical protein
MKPMKHNRSLIVLMIILAVLLVVAQFVQYGSLTRRCIYTETELPLNPQIASSFIRFHKGAAILEGVERGYECLPTLGTIDKRIINQDSVASELAQNPKVKIQYVDRTSDLKLTAVRLMAVTKHGISTIDSGAVVIKYLILKDEAGALYHVATVSLGINAGDEFLSAVHGDKETVLSPETAF